MPSKGKGQKNSPKKCLKKTSTNVLPKPVALYYNPPTRRSDSSRIIYHVPITPTHMKALEKDGVSYVQTESIEPQPTLYDPDLCVKQEDNISVYDTESNYSHATVKSEPPE